MQHLQALDRVHAFLVTTVPRELFTQLKLRWETLRPVQQTWHRLSASLERMHLLLPIPSAGSALLDIRAKAMVLMSQSFVRKDHTDRLQTRFRVLFVLSVPTIQTKVQWISLTVSPALPGGCAVSKQCLTSLNRLHVLLAIRAAKPQLALANLTTSALLDTIAANKRHRRIRWTCCAMLVSIAIAQQRLRKGGRTNAVLATTVPLEPQTDKVER